MNPAEQSARGQKILANYTSKTEQEGYVLNKVFEDLQENKIKWNFALHHSYDEMRLIEDKDILDIYFIDILWNLSPTKN